MPCIIHAAGSWHKQPCVPYLHQRTPSGAYSSGSSSTGRYLEGGTGHVR